MPAHDDRAANRRCCTQTCTRQSWCRLGSYWVTVITMAVALPLVSLLMPVAVGAMNDWNAVTLACGFAFAIAHSVKAAVNVACPSGRRIGQQQVRHLVGLCVCVWGGGGGRVGLLA